MLHPVGKFASNKPCPVMGGRRYLLSSEPDLASAFSCVATVGTAGDGAERPMDGMVAAVSNPLQAPGGCNEGFLRDDAILVITFISDDPNYEDTGTPAAWYDAIVAAKNGDPNAVVVLGLIPLDDLSCVNDGETLGTHWQQFVAMWGDRGIAESVCETDYTPFFIDAVDTIASTCNEFVPPG